MTAPEPGREVEQRLPLAGLVSFEPQNLDEAMTLSKILAVSQLVPWALQGKPADILIIMMYGRELGMRTIQALGAINVIKGRPSMSAELRVAKTTERGHRVDITCTECGLPFDQGNHRGDGSHKYDADWTARQCTVMAVRKDNGRTAVVTYTIEDAVQAGLVQIKDGKPWARSQKGERLPWETATRDMLYHRASDRACKMIAPEVAYGLYTAEEVENMPAADVEPARVEATVGEPIDPAQAAEDAANLQAEYQAGA